MVGRGIKQHSRTQNFIYMWEHTSFFEGTCSPLFTSGILRSNMNKHEETYDLFPGEHVFLFSEGKKSTGKLLAYS